MLKRDWRLSGFLRVAAAALMLATLVVPYAHGATQLKLGTSWIPDGQVGAAYSRTLSAVGGTTPYTWSVSAGTLPAGLTLNPTTGVLAGTPTAIVTNDTVTFMVTDAGNPVQTSTSTLTFSIAPAVLNISTASLPNGQLGVPYSQTVSATGGTTPYTWSLAGGSTLPPGLTLNSTTGAVTGTPTALGKVYPQFKVTDAGNPVQTSARTLSFSITPATLAITTASLPNGQVNAAYLATLTATGGTTPYKWSLSSGTLPSGLSLSASTGVISGTPTAVITGASLTFKVTDSGSTVQTNTVTLTLTVAPAGLIVTTTSLPNGQVGVPYSATLLASGGAAPYTWSLVSGAMPAGLSFNTSTGVISGTPTATVSATSLKFSVTDASSPAQSASATLTLTTAPAPVSITTTSLPSGQVGVPYSATLAASGGTTPYTWSISIGTLPAGLSLNASTGAISGTPTAAVSATPLTVKVTDSGNPVQSASMPLALTTSPASLKITTTSLPNGQAGVPYSATLAASGGTTPYTWSLTNGTLPSGLSLNTSTGAITGTPAAAVSGVALGFTATDAGSPAQSATVSLTLTTTPAALSITTGSLPNGQVGAAYSATLTATGGSTPYTWSLTGGTLPAGLSLNTSTGAITGTPTSVVTAASLTFTVTDSGNPTQTNSATLTVNVGPPGLLVATTSLPNGQVGVAYSATLAASGGTIPYAWSLTGGTLPAGLSLNSATGSITGTPSATVSGATLSFKVTDASNPAQSATAGLTLTISPAALSIVNTSLPNGQVGVAYSAALTASGGTTPYTWTLTSGTLPAGLSLNGATGAITGTPTAPVANASLTFKVTDAGNPVQSASASLTLTTKPAALSITTTSLPNGQVGVAYSTSLAATGGTAPYVWSLSSGTLPAGLSLNSATGAITGTPTAAVTGAPLTFTVTDAGNPSQSATASLTLTTTNTPTALTITTTALPNGLLGSAYSASLAASGGSTPYLWSLTSGTLPAGLTLNGSTGAISGTPAVVATATPLTFKVSDSGNPAQTSTVTLTLTVISPSLKISTGWIPDGQVGAAYSRTLVADGGTTPYTWSVSAGTLPAGLTLNPTTGVLSGTPTAIVYNTTVTFMVSDAGNPVQTSTLPLTFSIAPAVLNITSTSLPNGQVGVPYSATVVASGGTTPYAWSLAGGSTLPAGLTLNSVTGAVTGTPTATGRVYPQFKVTDAGNPAQTSAVTLSFNIAAGGVVITTGSLPNGQVGVPYSATLAAAGGAAPYTWSLTAGTLPVGLSLNSATGAITGTPTAVVTGASLTFKVTDSSNPAQSATATLSLTTINVASALAISTTSLPNGQVGAAYSATLAATGGTTPYTWSLSSGTLPAGLALNTSTGAITGTPTASVSGAPLTFKVTDTSNPAQSATVALTLTIAPATLSVATTSLPNGQVGTVYSATLAAIGGTKPYAWSITSGALPAGLSFNGSTGAISGTPTAAVTSTALTFKVTDVGTPVQSSTATLMLTVVSTGTLSISPRAAGLTVNQTLSVSATTDDPAGVTWTLSPAGGSVSPGSSLSGVPVTVTAPATAGVYTLTATGVSDTTRTATMRLGVTDLPGVLTWHDNNYRDGSNSREFALTTANVTTGTFGKLFSCPVDGAVYAQPLWAANLMVSGATHNVLFVATEHDSVYAFDADSGAQLWKASLVDSAHGATSGEVVVPGNQVGGTDIAPEIGITGTPVIDAAAGILYVVSKTVDSTLTTYYQRLHAIDLATGAERTGSPLLLAPSYPGTAAGGTTVTFNPQLQNQRSGLALVNGTVYVSWGSHEDIMPFYGWMAGYTYNGSSFTQTAALNVAPNIGRSGIWMSGAAPAADSSGQIYVVTGDGSFDVTNSTAPNNDYGDSLVKLTPGLTPSSYFTPSDQATRLANDMDFGAGGPVLLNLPAGSPQHLIVAAGKTTTVFVLDGDNLGSFGNANALQYFDALPVFVSTAFWNNTLYLAGSGFNNPLEAFAFDLTTNRFTTTPTSQSNSTYVFPGASPSISASGTTNGIVWALNSSQYCTHNSPGCGPAVLHAYDATNLANELWNSAMTGADAAGNAVKFTVPTVANGKVYVGTRGNNTGGATGSTSTPGQVDVYGLKP